MVMFFPDLALTRRLESHESWSSVGHTRIQAQLYPQTGAASQPIADGYAVFCGQKSPLNQVYGLGLSGPVNASDLDAMETFYRNRDRKVRVRVSPLADPSLLGLLRERGYSIEDFMNVYVRQVETLDRQPPTAHGLKIKVATSVEARDWFEQMGAGGDWAEPDGISFMLIRCTLKPGTRLFLAWRDGQPVGGGALEIHEGMAALMAAETLPAFRHQGIHTALLHARLAAAVEAGCDLAMVHTRPGAVSQGNILRSGFQLAYTSVSLFRSLSI
jgi:GNAT superfamily N-acetyltransferase